MLKKLIVLALLLICGVVFADDYRVVSDGLNIRQGPGTKYATLGVKYKDDIVNVIEITGNWAKIQYNNDFGYVNLTFIEEQKITKTEQPPSVPTTINTYQTKEDFPLFIIPIFIFFILVWLIWALYQRKLLKNDLKFEIFNFDTWDYATSCPLRWKGNLLFSAEDKKVLSEKDIVDLFRTTFNFLERNGDILTADKKISAIETLLDKMAKYQSNPCMENEVEEENMCKGIFDPRKTTTYQYADYNTPLVIDGVPIYSYEWNDEKGIFIKRPKDEGNFAFWLEHSIKNAPEYQLKSGFQDYYGSFFGNLAYFF